MDSVSDSKKARQYKPATVKLLFTLSGNCCAEPTCEKHVIGEDGKTPVGIISHIEAASPEGPRFNREMSNDERRDFSNLMVLCDEHHKIVDSKENESKFSVDLLRSWKTDHEAKMVNHTIQNNPTILSEVIDNITKIDEEDVEDMTTSLSPYKIEEKLSYNHVLRYRPFVDEYKIYYGKLDKIYREMDEYGDKRKKLFRIIKHIYLQVKGRYLEDGRTIENILVNSDDIFDEVKDVLENKIKNGGAIKIILEDVQVAVIILMVDAFIRCKILEEPPKNYVS